jgi:hypothetical protein
VASKAHVRFQINNQDRERDGRGGISVARKVLARMWLSEQKQLMDRLGVCKGSERD